MEYNSSRPRLIIPEYGRSIQKMIDYAVSLADREERNKIAKAIISVMGQLNPHLRDVNDFKHKLWDHLFIISDFKLDVDSPYPIPSREILTSKPERINYPSNDIRFKHYGKTIEMLIDKAQTLEDEEMKKALTETIANLMKKSYLSWNRDSVTDEVIFDHLKTLSKGKLKLDESVRLSNTLDILARNKTKTQTNKKKSQKGGFGKQKRFQKPS
jgi:hypothetical protein